ncbi:unnamed protein product [Trichobilharzia regenti]|nr:unnamed protein product [Trichobilharzia regenti]
MVTENFSESTLSSKVGSNQITFSLLIGIIKGGKRRKIPMDICMLPPGAIYRRADGGPPIMYIPKQIHHTDISRFDADHPPINPFQDDSAWYLDTPRRQYISFHAAALHNDLGKRLDF